jgi:hypothetical protein
MFWNLGERPIIQCYFQLPSAYSLLLSLGETNDVYLTFYYTPLELLLPQSVYQLHLSTYMGKATFKVQRLEYWELIDWMFFSVICWMLQVGFS